jgi:hypothetical protein
VSWLTPPNILFLFNFITSEDMLSMEKYNIFKWLTKNGSFPWTLMGWTIAASGQIGSCSFASNRPLERWPFHRMVRYWLSGENTLAALYGVL